VAFCRMLQAPRHPAARHTVGCTPLRGKPRLLLRMGRDVEIRWTKCQVVLQLHRAHGLSWMNRFCNVHRVWWSSTRRRGVRTIIVIMGGMGIEQQHACYAAWVLSLRTPLSMKACQKTSSSGISGSFGACRPGGEG